MRAGMLVLALAVLAGTVAGCADSVERDPLALTEGRACQAVEFDAVESVLGVRFDTRASAHEAETYTCVLAQGDRPYPDLTLAMSATAADEAIFTATFTPSLATDVTELGRVAYQVGLPAADGAAGGPALEVGWLSQAPRVMVLRYTWAADATADDVAALTPRLLDLARAIERAVLTAPTLALA